MQWAYINTLIGYQLKERMLTCTKVRSSTGEPEMPEHATRFTLQVKFRNNFI